MLAKLYQFRDDIWKEDLGRLGFFIGKFIYLMDAYEDVEKDIASRSYNPLKEAFANDSDFAGNCRGLLTLMMAECSREFEKLPILLHAEILRNVLYSGVWCRYTAVTAKRQESGESADTGCNDAENVTGSGSSSSKDIPDSDRDNSDTGV